MLPLGVAVPGPVLPRCSAGPAGTCVTTVQASTDAQAPSGPVTVFTRSVVPAGITASTCATTVKLPTAPAGTVPRFPLPDALPVLVAPLALTSARCAGSTSLKITPLASALPVLL